MRGTTPVYLVDGIGQGRHYHVDDAVILSGARSIEFAEARPHWRKEGDILLTRESWHRATYAIWPARGPIPFRQPFYIGTTARRPENAILPWSLISWEAPWPMRHRTQKTPWIHPNPKKENTGS